MPDNREMETIDIDDIRLAIAVRLWPLVIASSEIFGGMPLEIAGRAKSIAKVSTLQSPVVRVCFLGH